MCFFSVGSANEINIVRNEASPRLEFGAEKLAEKLRDNGYTVNFSENISGDLKGNTIVIAEQETKDWSRISSQIGFEEKKLEGKEAFSIRSGENFVFIEGSDASGALYGALELAGRIQETGALPAGLDLEEEPEMVLRGTVIGLQKTELLPGRGVYEYPYTPENFSWFYDKDLWIEYLDMMVENRYNSLYLWNGHPFASLVKLEDYPYAVEVDDETFKKNEEIFGFLTEEANKRGIWVIQMFYNIIVSKPFAEHHDIKTQERTREITPLLKDYTRKSIAAFIEKYPNVGLLAALGEAMSGIENDIDWFTNTIIPGVKDGLQALGRTDEPPIILRAHDTDAPKVMDEALKIYENLYTMHKYNGESLTTYAPRGPWTKIHRDLSSLGSIHISNVHILANLEPFRYGSPDFIQKSIKAMHHEQGANALHLYPQASYWDWPYTADKTDERLLEMERDWIWYEAWGRYAWNKERDRLEEINYWSDKLAEKFGANKEAGAHILKAYEETGEIAPKTLRRFGITEGNRQTLLLGMFGSQLVNPYKWRVYPGFYESWPVGEILIEYAEKEWNKEAHFGETPPQVIEEITRHGEKAVEAIDAASPGVTREKEEFERLKNDVYAYDAFASFFAEKVKAALWVLRYDHSGEVSDLEKALPHLEESVEHYKELVRLTKDTYLYANSMQTSMRRIPITGEDGKNKHWEELLPHYEEELENFQNNLELVRNAGGKEVVRELPEAWERANVEILTPDLESYPVDIGSLAYDNMNAQIVKFAPELKNLRGIKFQENEQLEKGTRFRFQNKNAVKLVVGYFNSDGEEYLTPPTLETNAAGNMRGEAETILANALQTDGLPPVNIHTYEYEPGEHEFALNEGKILILGFIDAQQEIRSRDVGLAGEGEEEAVDWLFNK